MKSLTPADVDALWRAHERGSTVYLVGAGGCGMSSLGHLLLDLGYKVAGSDLVENDATRQLQERGAILGRGHARGQLEKARPFLVIYSSAIQADNSELVAAQELQIPIARRGAGLAALLRRQRGICVAGMHGKTTTSALTAFALEQLGTGPSFAIGADVPQLSPPARFSFHASTQPQNSLPYFVVEADESDGTLVDFQPEHAILLNLDAEHLNYFSDIETVCREFQKFAGKVSGRVIYCADDSRLASLLASAPNAVSYGFHPQAQYRIERKPSAETRISHPASRGTRFAVWCGQAWLGDFAISLVGEQNISNAAAVIALLHQLQFQAPDIAGAIRSFRGAARRQQELYRDERCRVFDDYGHHPTEIRATLRALRELGSHRLLVAFQPHRFTRTQSLMTEFASCFQEADRLWLTEIYSAGEQPMAGINGAALADSVRRRGQPVEFVPALDQLGASVRNAMAPGDLILFLGAGDITEAAHELADQLRHAALVKRQSFRAELSRRLSPTSVVRQDEPLAKRTTLRVGGRADLYVEPTSEADLAAVLHYCAEHELPFLILGRGSNLLIQDSGIRGVVISLSQPRFCRVEVVGTELHCGAGAKLKAVAVEAKRHGLSGLEFLEGIPGSVGGALRMNAGAMGGAMFEVVESVRFMDFGGCVHEQTTEQLEVEYRSCPHFRNHIALSAILRGRPEAPELIAAKMTASNQKRWKSQPAAPSAGCIFKNPAEVPAGRLIEELGLKGARVGGAVVSDVHGNFIVNEGKATAEDILRLIELVQERARSARGIELETEVEIVSEVPPGKAWSGNLDAVDQNCSIEAKT